MTRICIGTAGWSIPRTTAHRFAGEGTYLQRYARVFRGAEINSSFYRTHLRTTYARWADSTPAGFQFAVKLPRLITHENQLRRSMPALDQFLEQISGLGAKRGPILAQLPPSFAFDRRVVARFLDRLRQRDDGLVVCEPRHPTWFSNSADNLLRSYQIGRVAADPPRGPGDGRPGGWKGVVYVRLHGTPRMYWSRYSQAFIEQLARVLQAELAHAHVWCVFDNTAAGAAIDNAWELATTIEQL